MERYAIIPDYSTYGDRTVAEGYDAFFRVLEEQDFLDWEDTEFVPFPERAGIMVEYDVYTTYRPLEYIYSWGPIRPLGYHINTLLGILRYLLVPRRKMQTHYYYNPAIRDAAMVQQINDQLNSRYVRFMRWIGLMTIYINAELSRREYESSYREITRRVSF